MKKVRTEEELAQAMEDKEDSIIIEGDLANKTIKLKATGSIAWLVAIGAIGVAVVAASSGVGIPVAAASAFAATTVLGISTTTAAVAIAVAAGGVGILDSLRDDYKIVEESSNRVVLKRK